MLVVRVACLHGRALDLDAEAETARACSLDLAKGGGYGLRSD